MSKQSIVNHYQQSDAIKQIVKQLQQEKHHFQLSNLVGSSLSFVISETFKQADKPYLLIFNDKEEAAYYLNDLEQLLGEKNVLFYPGSYRRPYQIEETDNANVKYIDQTNYNINTAYEFPLLSGTSKFKFGMAKFEESVYEQEVELDTSELPMIFEEEQARSNIDDKEWTLQWQHSQPWGDSKEIQFGAFLQNKKRDSNIFEAEDELELALTSWDQYAATPLTLAGILASVVLAATTGSDLGLAALASTQALSVDQQLRFSRKNEQEADRLGIEILYQSNYDPRAMPSMFERMYRKTRVDGNAIPEYLSTHPLSDTRISDSRNRANQFPVKKYKDSYRCICRIR